MPAVTTGAEIVRLPVTVVAGGAFQVGIMGVVRVQRSACRLPRQLTVRAVARQAGLEGHITGFGCSVTARATDAMGYVFVRQPCGFSGRRPCRRKVRADEDGGEYNCPCRRPSKTAPNRARRQFFHAIVYLPGGLIVNQKRSWSKKTTAMTGTTFGHMSPGIIMEDAATGEDITRLQHPPPQVLSGIVVSSFHFLMP